jgi:hypothetical protein
MTAPHIERDEVALRFALVRARYGAHISPTDLDAVRKGVAHVVATAEALRAITLDNDVAPFTVFRPYRTAGDVP